MVSTVSVSSKFHIKIFHKNFSWLLFREVPANYSKPHLIFTNTGDEQTLPHVCASYVGMMSGTGQIVNLGSPECLAIGKILHETLHALGFKF